MADFPFVGTPKHGPITAPMDTLKIDEVDPIEDYALDLKFKGELVGKFVGTVQELEQYLDEEYIALLEGASNG